jgi:hypothetical protein
VQGEGDLPPLKWSCRRNGKGEAQRRSAQAKRGRLGKPLVRASGAAPLAGFLLLPVSDNQKLIYEREDSY